MFPRTTKNDERRRRERPMSRPAVDDFGDDAEASAERLSSPERTSCPNIAEKRLLDTRPEKRETPGGPGEPRSCPAIAEGPSPTFGEQFCPRS